MQSPIKREVRQVGTIMDTEPTWQERSVLPAITLLVLAVSLGVAIYFPSSFSRQTAQAQPIMPSEESIGLWHKEQTFSTIAGEEEVSRNRYTILLNEQHKLECYLQRLPETQE